MRRVHLSPAPFLAAALVIAALAALSVLFAYRAEAIPFIVDLNSSSADFEVYGGDRLDYLRNVAVGDINGDTIGDLITSSYDVDSAVGKDTGAAYVVYGSASLPASLDLETTAPDLTVTGAEVREYAGSSIAAGDINGDTVDDLVIGAFSGSSPSGSVGRAYVIYGDASLPATIDLSTTSADLLLFGDAPGDSLGWSVAVGDVNGDTVGDLIVGARGADPAGGSSAGAVYVIYGGPGLPATIDLNASSADVTVLGADARDNLGVAVATGDINGDTVQDLILGAPSAIGSPSNRGRVHVIYGGSLPSVIDLNSVPADFTMIAEEGPVDLGIAVAAGDVNGDGIDDVIAGAERPGTYVQFGGPGLPAVLDLDVTAADLAVLGVQPSDHAGWSVAAGDVDGDTVGDVIIGAPHVATTDAGEVYVVYGSVSLPAVIDLAVTAAGVTVKGRNANDQLGNRVAVGDITGDTVADLIASAPEGNGGATLKGAVYVLEGGSRPPPTDTPTPTITPTPCPTQGCPTSTSTVTPTITQTPTVTPTPTPIPKTLIHIEIAGTSSGFSVSCDSRTQSSCKLDGASSFTLQLVPSVIPPTGYAGWQTFLDYGSLLYKPAGSVSEEISWDVSLIQVRAPAAPSGKEGNVGHAAVSAFFAEFPLSFQTASFLSLQFNCAKNGESAGQPFSQLVQLMDFNQSSSGTAFFDGDTVPLVPNPSSLTIECNPSPTKQPPPGDTDLDGCEDLVENGPDEAFGGQRNYLYYWDFYDVWTHPSGDPLGWERNKVINLFDIIAVGMRFGPGPDLSKVDAFLFALVPPADGTSYHAAYDRGPIIGANPWDRGPPDASINIVDDILGVAAQFGHNCE